MCRASTCTVGDGSRAKWGGGGGVGWGGDPQPSVVLLIVHIAHIITAVDECATFFPELLLPWCVLLLWDASSAMASSWLDQL